MQVKRIAECSRRGEHSAILLTFIKLPFIFKPFVLSTVKLVLSGLSKRSPKIGFQDWLLLNADQKDCRMLQESILQYFWPSLSYLLSLIFYPYTVKPVLSGLSKRSSKIVYQERLLLKAGQMDCRMIQESILQYFLPSLSYLLSLSPLFCLFLSGRLRQVLL